MTNATLTIKTSEAQFAKFEGTTFPTVAAAQAFLNAMPRPAAGYDKVYFEVTFENGPTGLIRYDHDRHEITLEEILNYCNA